MRNIKTFEYLKPIDEKEVLIKPFIKKESKNENV